MRTSSMLGLVLASLGLLYCSTVHTSRVFEFGQDGSITAEYFDVAITVRSVGKDVELVVDAAQGEKSVNFSTRQGLYRTLRADGKISQVPVRFVQTDDAVHAFDGASNVGRVAKVDAEGVAQLALGTFNVRVIAIKDRSTIMLEDPVLAIAGQGIVSTSEITEFSLDKIENYRAMIVRPEYDQSGIMSPRHCTLVRSGEFLYARLSSEKDLVPVAYLTKDKKAKMLSGFRSKLVQLANENYVWISPR